MSESAGQPEPLSVEKRALLALRRMQSRLETLEGEARARTEPIAIIGIGCRLPGGVTDAESLWALLRDGVDAISEVPADRWDINVFYDPDPDAPGKMNTRWGGFLTDADRFDADFFGVSPREAVSMDPQQRLLLEVAWEALENAGIAPDAVAGSATGTFIGISGTDYGVIQMAEPAAVTAYGGVGNAMSIAANRVSYQLDLRGPCAAIDTACSASLVAVHLAVQSLHAGECRMALAGGVNLTLSPVPTISFSKARMMAPDGRCKTFDARANGYVRGEGCGLVVLKRLSDAQADGDNILAVIRGSAVNQDGRSTGLTAPNLLAQQEVIRQALASGGVSPERVGYVEAHGTGTSLGDPIEVEALTAVVGIPREDGLPCALGSIKTNIGHLEGAAGVAGLLKAVLTLQHGEIPPHPHLQRLNPMIQLAGTSLEIPTRLTALRPDAVVGVSSFGFGGTNAHIVLEAAPAAEPVAEEAEQEWVLPLSARDETALHQLAARYATYLEAHPQVQLAEVARTLALGRAHFGVRAVVVAKTLEEAREQFASLTPRPPSIQGKGESAAPVPPNANGSLPSPRGGGAGGGVYSLAQRYLAGETIDWAAEGYAGRRLPLPTYPFQRQRYWMTPPATPRLPAQPVASIHPLLGHPVRSPLETRLFEVELGAAAPGYLGDHRVFGAAVFPAAGYLEQALAAGAALSGKGSLEVTNLTLREALTLPENGTLAVQTTWTPEKDAARLEIYSAPSTPGGDTAWRLHAQGRVRRSEPQPVSEEGLAAAQAHCREPLSPAELYAGMATGGIAYGSTFQGVISLWRGAGEALGQIHAPEEIDLTGYQLHPALLDACLQVVAAVTVDADAEESVYLPILFQRVRWHPGAGVLAWSHATLRNAAEASPEARTFDLRLYDAAGALAVEIDGLVLKRATATSLRGSEERWREWLYQVAWEPSPLTEATAKTSVQSPSVVATALTGRAETLARENGHAAFLNARSELHALCIAYAVRAYLDLGVEFAPGRLLHPDTLVSELRVLPAHRRMVRRLLELLAEADYLASDPEEPGAWRVLAEPPAPGDLEARFRSLTTRYPEGAPELTLLARCGVHLAAVLRGETDPLQLLFPGGSTADLERVYRDAPGSRVSNALVVETMQQVVAGLGEQGRLRVLELGAGTGGTTAGLLPLLPPNRTDYLFTDVSPVFPARATATFSQYPFLQGRVLDVEQSPATQGLAGERFDVVLAANVLHATADLQTTLTHVRELLAPGGLLVLVEATERAAWVDLVFGLTEGWWRFTDRELRPEHPLLTVEQWCALLTTEGFSEVAALGEAPGDGFAPTVLLARRESEAASNVASGTCLLLADAGKTASSVAARLTAAGKPCYLVHAPDAAGSVADLLAEVAEAGLPPVAEICDFRPLNVEGPSGDLELQEQVSGGVLRLVRDLALHTERTPRLWLITRGAQAIDGIAPNPAQASLWGLGKVIALEQGALDCRRVDLDPTASDTDADTFLTELRAASTSPEDQVAYRDGIRLAARLERLRLPTTSASDAPVTLALPTRGTLEALEFQSLTRRSPGPGEVEIQVTATGLNFRDVLNALGMYPGDPGPPGSECAGVVSAVGSGVNELAVGDAVVAIAPAAFSSYVVTSAQVTRRLPEGMTPEQAATLPIAFVTAGYALRRIGRLVTGERVLIHAATGGVGLAAVQLAQWAGAEIYATAGSDEKREYLRSFGIQHVFDSRSLSFAEEIRAATGGEGVDVVLNSLAGEFIPAGLGLLRAGGRFLEIGKRELWEPERLAREFPGVEYHAIAMDEVVTQEPKRAGQLLEDTLAECATGRLQPLPLRSFPLAEVRSAFRTMAGAKHLGKIVVTHPVEGGALRVRADGAYLVVGGMGGLGLLTARWLVEHGARHLTLLGRSAPTAEAQAAIADLEAKGATITVERADVSQRSEVGAVLARLRAAGQPLRGVIHSAGALDDGVLASQTWERFETVLGPKMVGAWHLHELTREDPLDLFVLYSSTASLLGSAGQGNHAAANAYLDALAHYRRGLGLPATTFNWGPWSEVGAAVSRGVSERMSAQGIGTIPPAEGLAALEATLRAGITQAGVIPVEWPRFLRALPGGTPPFLSRMDADRSAANSASATGRAEETSGPSGFLAQMQEAPAPRRREMLAAGVRGEVVRVLALPTETVPDPRRPLQEMGLDSLMAVELRNNLGGLIGKPLSATLLFDFPTIEALGTHLWEEATELHAEAPTQEAPAASNGGAPTAVAQEVAGLSEEEVLASIAAELSALGERSGR